ncbi:MAG: hypothetical protein AAFQ27_02455 [Pseudomonadota bacterium]
MSGLRKQYRVFADYFQFYLWDHGTQPDAPTDYDDADSRRRIKVAPYVIVVLTERNMTVPVELTVLDSAPPLELDRWDHLVEASIEIPSGKLEVFECCGQSIDVLAIGEGSFRARVGYAGLDTLSPDGLDGDDIYSVSLWPAPVEPEVVLKTFERVG